MYNLICPGCFNGDNECVSDHRSHPFEVIERGGQRMEAILNNSAHGIVIVNADGMIQFVNSAAEQLFQRSPAELVGSAFGFPLVIGEYSEVDLVSPNGSSIAVELRVSETVWDDQTAFVVVLRDLTERQRISQELYQAKRLNEAVMDSLLAHIAVVAPDGMVLAVNKAWVAFAKANGDASLAHTSVGANYFEVCRRSAQAGDELAAQALDGLLSVLRGEQPRFELEYPCQLPNETRCFLMRATPLADRDMPGLVIAHTDISEHAQAARQQMEAEQQAASAEQQHQEWISWEALARPSEASGSAGQLLRDKLPDRFSELVERCAGLLDEAVYRRIDGQPHAPSEELRALAEYLGLMKAGPRDVMEVYLAALKARMQTASPPKTALYLEEGRILVLELMGYLAGFYRNYLPPIIRNPMQ